MSTEYKLPILGAGLSPLQLLQTDVDRKIISLDYDGSQFGIDSNGLYIDPSGVNHDLLLNVHQDVNTDASPILAGATIGNVVVPGVFTAMTEPTGFVNRTAVISWDDGTYTLTITGDHDIYINGVKTTKGTASKQITDATGLYYIYYNASGTLTVSTVHPGFALPLMATVYWNTVTDKGLIGEERHGIKMDGDTHTYLHYTVGTRYESGLAGTFADTTFSIAAGIIDDEDLVFSITPAKTTCNVLYKDGAADFKWLAGQTKYYYEDGGSDLNYNAGNVLTPLAANKYMAVWIFATNDTTTPIVSLIGQRTDTTLADARNNNKYESLTLGTLPYQEMKLLYRVILQNTATPYVEAQDLRNISNLPAGTYVATAHNVLTGLDYDLAGHTGFAPIASPTFTGTVTMPASVVIPDGGTVGQSAGPLLTFDDTNNYLEVTGCNVGIGTSAPSQALDLIGSLELENTTTSTTGVIYKGADRFIHNFQHPTGGGAVPDGRNTFVGVLAGNLTMGSTATSTYHGSYNTAVGTSSIRSNTTGYMNTAVGTYSLYTNTTGNQNTAIGYDALVYNTIGNYNTAEGCYTLYSLTEGGYNTAVGTNSGYYLTTGSSNIFLGFRAGYRQTTLDNILIIDNQDRSSAANEITNSLIYGVFAAAPANQTLRINGVLTPSQGIVMLDGGTVGQAAGPLIAFDDTNNYLEITGCKVGIGTTAPNQALDLVGSLALESTTTSTTGVIYKGGRFIHNFQHPTGGGAVPDGYNIFMGLYAGNFTTGSEATQTYHGSDNVGLGAYALSYVTTGYMNNAMGYSSLYLNTTGYQNTAIGHKSLRANTAGYNNTAIGAESGLLSTTGVGNIFLGYSAGCRQTDLGNLLIIDNQDRTSAALEITNSLIYGVFAAAPANQTLRINGVLTPSQGILMLDGGTIGQAAGPLLNFDDTNNYLEITGCNVGIGTTNPYTKLTVEGTITLKEQASADADTAAYGQLWVKTATPNQLWFTNDAGTDVQLGVVTGSAFTSKCRAYLGTTQAIADSTWSIVLFDTEDYDTDSEFDTVTNKGRFTAAVTGYYHFDICVRFTVLGDQKIHYCRVLKNAATEFKAVVSTSSGNNSQSLVLSGDIYLVATEYFVVQVYQGTGGSINLVTNIAYQTIEIHRFA